VCSRESCSAAILILDEECESYMDIANGKKIFFNIGRHFFSFRRKYDRTE
jgi:hypothetical protein